MQLGVLVVLRISIGWLILYEGIGRVMNPTWSLTNFLIHSKGFLSGYFNSLTAYHGLINFLEFINEWGLILIGMGLIFGLLVKLCSYTGMIFAVIAYFAHPPLLGFEYISIQSGRYLFINEMFILIVVLWIFVLFPTSNVIGLDRFISGKK